MHKQKSSFRSYIISLSYLVFEDEISLSSMSTQLKFKRTKRISSLSSMDSGLEAFSHNPTDGSITPLAFQPDVYTKYLNQRFLSY